MPYDFFFSYPRAADNPYMKKFFDELHDAVRGLRGVGKNVRVGFFDQRDLDRGANWPEDLQEALQTSKTLVALYSPAYFKGTFCEQELRIFDLREREYEKQLAADGKPVGTSKTIKPVPWIMPFDLPADLGHLQYQVGGEDSIERKGIFAVRKSKASYARKYNDYIDALALDIKNTADRVTLPRLGKFPALHSSQLANTESLHVDDEGPGHVKFVYIATTSDKAKTVRQQLDHYGPQPRAWKPFLPELKKGIGPIAQAVAGDYDFTSDELTFSPTLPDDIQRAEDRKNVVVILMDGWSVRVPGYATVLQALDRLRLSNCGILVPWNMNDVETTAQRQLLATEVRQALWRWSQDANPVHFNDEITNADQLRDRLAIALEKLRTNLVMASRPGDLTGPPRPVITNS